MKAAEFLRAFADIIDVLDNNGVDAAPADDTPKLDQNPVFVSPLQQELELAKAALGKQSPVIDKILADENIGDEPESDKYYN